jgi:hypothetical protein
MNKVLTTRRDELESQLERLLNLKITLAELKFQTLEEAKQKEQLINQLSNNIHNKVLDFLRSKQFTEILARKLASNYKASDLEIARSLSRDINIIRKFGEISLAKIPLQINKSQIENYAREIKDSIIAELFITNQLSKSSHNLKLKEFQVTYKSKFKSTFLEIKSNAMPVLILERFGKNLNSLKLLENSEFKLKEAYLLVELRKSVFEKILNDIVMFARSNGIFVHLLFYRQSLERKIAQLKRSAKNTRNIFGKINIKNEIDILRTRLDDINRATKKIAKLIAKESVKEVTNNLSFSEKEFNVAGIFVLSDEEKNVVMNIYVPLSTPDLRNSVLSIVEPGAVVVYRVARS